MGSVVLPHDRVNVVFGWSRGNSGIVEPTNRLTVNPAAAALPSGATGVAGRQHEAPMVVERSLPARHRRLAEDVAAVAGSFWLFGLSLPAPAAGNR